MERAAVVRHMRNRLARDLSRFAKVTWAVWWLVVAGVIFPSTDAWSTTMLRFCSFAGLLGLGAMIVSFPLSIGRNREGAIALEPSGLAIRLGAARVLLRPEHVASAHAEGKALRVLERGGDEWHFELGEASGARTLARELGFGPSGKATRYDFGSPQQRALHVCIALATVVAMFLLLVFAHLQLGPLRTVAFPVGVSLFYAVAVLKLRLPILTVGVDGLRIEQRGNVQTVPLGAIASVDAESLRLADGQTIQLVGDGDRCIAFAAHLRELLASAAPDPLVRFARGDLPVRVWTDRIRAALHHADYRVAPNADPETLAAHMGAARATLEDRVAAALALRVADPAGGPPRIRVAAEQCVSPAARAALQAAADCDDARVEKALRRR